jgi:hypothetical protein
VHVKTVSEANCSQHWVKKKKRHDIQKKSIWAFFKRDRPKIPFPCRIKLTRLGKKILDDDNLPVSMKYIRDAIADQIFPGLAPGQADNDKRLSWEYNQQISKDYGVLVQFFRVSENKIQDEYVVD